MSTAWCATGAAPIPGLGKIVVGRLTRVTKSAPSVNYGEIFLTNSSLLGNAGSWCEITPMLNPREFQAAEFFNGKIIAEGDFTISTHSVEMLSVNTVRPVQWT